MLVGVLVGTTGVLVGVLVGTTGVLVGVLVGPTGVLVGVLVGTTGVLVGVAVGVGGVVPVAVAVGGVVAVLVAVGGVVGVLVAVAVDVPVDVAVGTGGSVGISVGVAVGVLVAVAVLVAVGGVVAVLVGVGVPLGMVNRPLLVVANDTSSLNIKLLKVNALVLPRLPTTLKAIFTRVPLPLSGAALKAEMVTWPATEVLAVTDQPVVTPLAVTLVAFSTAELKVMVASKEMIPCPVVSPTVMGTVTAAPLAPVASTGRLTATPPPAYSAGGLLHPKERMRLITVTTDKMCFFISSAFWKDRNNLKRLQR